MSKITTRLLHNILLTKSGKNFVILNWWRQNHVKIAVWLQVIESLTEKTWGQGSVDLVVRTKWLKSPRKILLVSRIYFVYKHGENSMHEDGRHLLFGVHLQTWTNLYLLNFPIKMHYRYEFSSIKLSMFKLVFKLGIILKG